MKPMGSLDLPFTFLPIEGGPGATLRNWHEEAFSSAFLSWINPFTKPAGEV